MPFIKGYKYTEKDKEKMRIYQNNRTEEHKHKIMDTQFKLGESHPHTAEWDRKIRETHIKNREKHKNWRGGTTKERDKIKKTDKYKQWRKLVFERDKYTCLICGKVGGILNAHHIRAFADYPELRFNIDNGVALCQECHRIGNNEMPLFFITKRIKG